MTGIARVEVFQSVSENAEVEHRGLTMGKVYVFWPNSNDLEAEFVFTPHGIAPIGSIVPTREQKNRAIRALAQSPWGEKVLGYPRQYPEGFPPPDPKTRQIATIPKDQP